MLFNTLLIFMINIISIDRLNHINDLKWINRILVVKNDKKFDFYNKYDSYLKDFEERDFIIINIKGKNTFINNTEMSKYFTKSVFEKIKAPTIVIPEIALAPDISGVCKVGGTFVISSKPKKIANMKTVIAPIRVINSIIS